MKSKDKFKLSNGNEVLIGLNIYNKWNVSCWDNDFNAIWVKVFQTESEAREYFDKLESKEA